MLKEVGRVGLLNNLAAVKYDDAIGYIGNNTQVMSYYHDAHSVFASQLLDQIHNLRLYCYIKSCRRFVRQQNLTGQRHCNHDSLAHTAG